MIPARFDILGIGNAIVDILAEVDDSFLAEQGMNRQDAINFIIQGVVKGGGETSV